MLYASFRRLIHDRVLFYISLYSITSRVVRFSLPLLSFPVLLFFFFFYFFSLFELAGSSFYNSISFNLSRT